MDKIDKIFETFWKKHIHNIFRHLFWLLKSWKREDCTARMALIHDMNNITIKCTSETCMEMEYLRQRYLAEKMQDCLEQRNILLDWISYFR